MLEFAHGVRCGEYGVHWLEINAANCFGDADKDSWGARLQWTNLCAPLISDIARDPVGTVELWRKAAKPLQFVRACMELDKAWKDPNFETCLPVGLDATASGLQNLALLGRDADTMWRVNLTLDHDKPRDIYADVGDHVLRAMGRDKHPWAVWWRARLSDLDPRKRRKLFKGPVSTYAYAATDMRWVTQILEEYQTMHEAGLLEDPIPRDKAGNLVKRRGTSAPYYLVLKIREACCELLPGPTAVMAWL
jgi:DNA-directed RNA polymerase